MQLIGTLLTRTGAYAVYSSDDSLNTTGLLQLVARLETGGVAVLPPCVRVIAVGEDPAPKEVEAWE